MTKRAPTRADHLRSAVAQEAARLMAEHGIEDFLVAKRKAAERFGVFDRAMLPKNSEVEVALLSYHRLFGGTHYKHSLIGQRHAALQAMQLLDKFEPRLVGPVLAGSATGFGDIQLHVFSDDPEAVFVHLIDRNVGYETLERRMRMAGERQVLVPSARFQMGSETVEAFVFPRNGLRQAPTSPVDGKPMKRADKRALMELIERATDTDAPENPCRTSE